MITIIYTSDVGVGAVLLQGGKDDIYLPNLLKSVTKIRKNNPQFKKKSILMYISSTYHNTATFINNVQNTNHRSPK
jgi:hypothetical protein